LITFEEYAHSNSFSETVKNMYENVTSDIVQRSLFINNLPLDITKEAVLKHLQLFNIVISYLHSQRVI
jgi:RNA recognition motif-containing protein